MQQAPITPKAFMEVIKTRFIPSVRSRPLPSKKRGGEWGKKTELIPSCECIYAIVYCVFKI